MKKRVLLVDDHTAIRQMLSMMLGRDGVHDVAGESGSGREALALCQSLRPDIMVLDLLLPELNGVEVLRQVAERHPRMRVLIFSAVAHQEMIIEALRCRPAGFVGKGEPLQVLREALNTVAGGGSYFTPFAARHLFETRINGQAEKQTLTLREREVLQMVAEGRSSKEIACRLMLSSKTVENHRANLMEKLGRHDVASLTRFAMRHGMVSEE